MELPSKRAVFPCGIGEPESWRGELRPEDMWGAWTLNTGRFGCLNSETRGGLVVVQAGGRIFGGDGLNSLSGHWSLDGREFRARLVITLHPSRPDNEELIALTEDVFGLDLYGFALDPDYLEGRFSRPGIRIFVQ